MHSLKDLGVVKASAKDIQAASSSNNKGGLFSSLLSYIPPLTMSSQEPQP